MKSQFTLMAAVWLAVSLVGCKKNIAPAPDAKVNDNAMVLASSSPNLYQVSTLAGSFYTNGPTIADGKGTAVRFYSPNGLDLKEDGTIYIADANPGVIRKMTPDGTVSSIKLPNATSGEQMLSANYVGVANDGTINVITSANLNSDFPEAWVFKPNKPGFVQTDYYASFANLVKDPYSNAFYFTQGYQMGKYVINQNGRIGTDFIEYDIDKLNGYHSAHSSFRAAFIGYNKVKYFSDGQFLYKYTPSGVSQYIFPDLDQGAFINITCIVANKDSRTLYVADAGYIRRIDNGKVSTIAGPNSSNDNRDGKGRAADVYARSLALSKDEGTLFFSDAKAQAIRKILLR